MQADSSLAEFLKWTKIRKSKLPSVYCSNRHCRAYLGELRWRTVEEDICSWKCSLCHTFTYIVREVTKRLLPTENA